MLGAMRRAGWMVALVMVSAWGCADEPVPDYQAPSQPYSEHAEPLDFEATLITKSHNLGLPTSFDGNNVMSDAFLQATNALTVAQVQAFLERTPYGNRSWIADARTPDGRRASEAIVAACNEFQINPIAMLARMQVEQRAISTATPISNKARDYTLGCGCPDNQPCNTAYKGLYKQVQCGARTMRNRYNTSVDRSFKWRRGHTHTTLDGYAITPANHATAAMYAYTPWRGSASHQFGNWLVWNITLKYARHFVDNGGLNLDGAPDNGDDAPAPGAPSGTWIGESCGAGGVCSFDGGYCLESPTSGVCSQSCAGYCPDRDGKVTTFCVDASHFGGAGGGVCSVKADPRNDDCRGLGLVARELPRYIGNSNARESTARVCVFDPNAAAPAPEAPADPAPEAEEPPATPPADVPPEGEGAPPEPELEADGSPRCSGTIAVRQVDGATDAVDCAGFGLACSDGVCVGAGPGQPVASNDPRCATLDFSGDCKGQIAVYCDAEGNYYAQDCVAWGTVCGWGDDGDGHWCRP